MFCTSRRVLLLIPGLILLFTFSGYDFLLAKEGMWIPATLKKHELDMHAEGLQIPVSLIYNENGTGLNNAVVLFGRGCTGEVISPGGLILTNHHCGYGSVQGLSSAEHDYFANGFFAKNIKEEIPAPGLSVTFVRRMENVTPQILEGIDDTLHSAGHDSLIAARIMAVEAEFRNKTHMDATIKPYFEGNQYWVALTETYRDVRLVGFPPNGIGAFGGDVENWMWPRHTGDFSLFRVYAGPDNKPADYSPNNKPYMANQYYKINAGGYKEGDFTMVYGFPGTTEEYISSYELKEVYSINDPIAIAARTRKLDVWNKHMATSRDIFLKYTSKRAGVANGWKKWQGEVRGLEVNHAMEKKQKYEQAFQKWASTSSLPYAKHILPEMKEATAVADPLITEDQYNRECPLAIELVQQGAAMEKIITCFRLNLADSALTDTLKKVVNGMNWFYRNYDLPTDKDVFVTLMSLYFTKCANSLPEYYKTQYVAHNQDLVKWANDIYSTSMLADKDKIKAFAAGAKPADSTKAINDPAWQLYNAINLMRKQQILPALKDYYTRMHYLNRLYMKAQMAWQKSKTFYPDANLTLRVTYGKVKGLKTEADPTYLYQTTLAETVALDDSTSDIFKVPQKLKELYRKKDYGRWGEHGKMPVAFIASNHTSGGNSGSPVLNAKGELMGINFDRAYEGTMSDYYFDPNRCRNISVDIRYVLFIIEKFGDAGWLVDEMKIVK